MSFEPLQPRSRTLLVCTNVRDPSFNRASCGANGGIGLKDRLKASVKEAGRKKDVLVVGTGCLGYCPAKGCAVAMLPENEWMVMTEEQEEEMRTRILQP